MDKPHLSLTAQRELLRSRGLELGSDEETDRALYDRSYYRISGYARQFQVDPKDGRNDFIPGTSLAQILELMDLDEELRKLLFSGLTEVELSVRSRFAHEAAGILGADAFYLRPESYLRITPDLDAHVTSIERELRRPSVTVSRYRSGDDLSRVPVWVAIEMVSFGVLARMVQYLEDSTPARRTAQSLSLPWTGFQPTIHALAVLRNGCAHHAQLWHRRSNIVAAPEKKDLRNEREYAKNAGSIYATIIALKRYTRALDRHSPFGERVDELLDRNASFADGVCFPSAR
jgi:abortive infection bacteriophage resistance protein